MKKRNIFMALLSVLLVGIAASASGAIASVWIFHQPRVPKALTKKEN